MDIPIYKRLTEYHNQNRISFAMPGHKNMRTITINPCICDVTELSETLNLLDFDNPTTAKANRLLSKLYQTRESFILTCGSTSCIQAMILSVLNAGDTLLASSDCHMSVINICAVAGIRLKLTDSFKESDIDGASAVLVTSPNYYGVTKDIHQISHICHNHGIPILVDEAHGAHFLGRCGLPQSATVQGADIVCHSAHKTLDAFTGASYLHICTDRVDISRIKRCICAVHTSSPSYIIAASADFARAYLCECDYSEIINECTEFKRVIGERTGICVLRNDDDTRIVLDFKNYDITGFEVDKMLSKRYFIDVEMADVSNIILIATPQNRHLDFISLYHALLEITENLDVNTEKKGLIKPKCPTGIIAPQNGMFAKTEHIRLCDAEGRVSAVTVCMYPPGTAIIVMGQRIGHQEIEYISELEHMGAKITGLNAGTIEVIV